MAVETRKRRAAFDREQGVEIARAQFHARGYDAVSVADLTQALGIVPPSLYAAYGSKLALFERALQQYVATDTLPVWDLLASDGAPAEVLTELFVMAARHYTRDAVKRGCMVTEAMRADDKQASALATKLAEQGSEAIRTYVAAHAAPDNVERIVDYVLVTLRGLSSYACLGNSQEKLVGCAKIAGSALQTEFPVKRRATFRK
jgi:TetR/AcrR family transcriptional repressor for divergent bdcA